MQEAHHTNFLEGEYLDHRIAFGKLVWCFRIAYGCLYGIHTTANITVPPGQLPSSFFPVIPDGIAFLGLVQILFSAVLIFLFLLAVRNHFRIK